MTMSFRDQPLGDDTWRGEFHKMYCTLSARLTLGPPRLIGITSQRQLLYATAKQAASGFAIAEWSQKSEARGKKPDRGVPRPKSYIRP